MKWVKFAFLGSVILGLGVSAGYYYLGFDYSQDQTVATFPNRIAGREAIVVHRMESLGLGRADLFVRDNMAHPSLIYWGELTEDGSDVRHVFWSTDSSLMIVIEDSYASSDFQAVDGGYDFKSHRRFGPKCAALLHDRLGIGVEADICCCCVEELGAQDFKKYNSLWER